MITGNWKLATNQHQYAHHHFEEWWLIGTSIEIESEESVLSARLEEEEDDDDDFTERKFWGATINRIFLYMFNWLGGKSPWWSD